MKRIFSMVAVLFLTAMVLCAEEKVLLSSSTTANLGEGIEYAQNFNATSKSGYFGGSLSELKTLEPSERGFRAMAVDVPRFNTTNYVFEGPYPAFVNTDENGDAIEGAGFIDNAATIKSILVKDVLLNRPYDTLYLLYSTSPFGDVKKVKLEPVTTNDDGTITKNAPVPTMSPVNFYWENSNYNDNVKTREIKADPALGGNATGIYFRGLLVQANPAYGNNEYSPWSITYFKEISVIYDKRFTDEQWALRKELQKEWSVDDGAAETRQKAVNEITYRKTLEDAERQKMHQDSQNSSDAK